MGPDIAMLAFKAISDALLDGNVPVPFRLDNKGSSQEDPFDCLIGEILSSALRKQDIVVEVDAGSLVSPDLVLYRVSSGYALANTPSTNDVIGIEVKKVEVKARGARLADTDYNSTPPCGTIRVYDQDLRAIDVPGFYLFATLEGVPGETGTYVATSLALVDGNMLNADFGFYLSMIGERTKTIGLGTYGDGANRERPMLLFSNPLGAGCLAGAFTLVHRSSNLSMEGVREIGTLSRSTVDGEFNTFHCYRTVVCAPSELAPVKYVDPFRMPERSEKTSQRGRFRLQINKRGHYQYSLFGSD